MGKFLLVDDKMNDKRNFEKEEEKRANERADEYVKDLLREKQEIDAHKAPNVVRLIEQEVLKTQEAGKISKDVKFVDIYKEKPIRVAVKVLVPVKEHPKFNFVGKLLGPKGNSMKRLQEETMCKMAVLGRGSMKDKQKEEEFRQGTDPKYAHLNDELHVEIVAMAPPAEAHARIAFALAEIRKYLIPDNNDNIRQEQLREMEVVIEDHPIDDRRPNAPRSGILRPPSSRPQPPPTAMRAPAARPILAPPPAQAQRGAPNRNAMPNKTKVFSILDRARVAMDQSYGYESGVPQPNSRDYDYPSSSSGGRYPPNDPYSSSTGEDMYSQPQRYNSYEYEEEPVSHSSHDYYDQSDYQVPRSMKFSEEPSNRAWKSYKTTTTGAPATTRYRSAPYSRPNK